MSGFVADVGPADRVKAGTGSMQTQGGSCMRCRARQKSVARRAAASASWPTVERSEENGTTLGEETSPPARSPTATATGTTRSR